MNNNAARSVKLLQNDTKNKAKKSINTLNALNTWEDQNNNTEDHFFIYESIEENIIHPLSLSMQGRKKFINSLNA